MARRQKRRTQPASDRMPRERGTRRSRVELARALEQAERLADQGSGEAILELLEPFLETHTRVPELHYYLGHGHVLSGDLWRGIGAYEQAARLDNDPSYLLSLAGLYLQTLLRAHALRALQQASRFSRDVLVDDSMLEAIPLLRNEIADLAEKLGVSPTRAEEGLYHMEDGQIALNLGDYGASIAASRRAIRQLPDWPPSYNNLSMAQFYSGHSEGAIETVRRVLSKMPDNIHALSNGIRYLAWTGRKDEAEDLWQQLRELDPEQAELRFKAAEAAAALEKDEPVYRLLEPVDRAGWDRELPPGLVPRAQLVYALAMANLGHRGARRRLQRLRDRYPWVQELLKALGAGKPGPGWARRYPYYHSTDLLIESQLADLEGLLKRREQLGEQRFRREVEHFVQRYPTTVTALEKMIWEEGLVEGAVGLLNMIGTPAAYAALRRFGLSQTGEDEQRMEALHLLAEAGQINADQPQRVWVDGKWREVLLIRHEISDEFVSEYDPEVAEALNEGVAALQEGDDKRAERLLRRALELDPRAKHAYNNLGTIYGQRDERERAQEMYRAALEIDPTYVYPRCNLALYALEEGDVEEALTMIAPLAKLRQFLPQDMAYYSYIQARIALAREEYDAARRFLEMGLEIVPDHEPSQSLLARVELLAQLREGFSTLLEDQRQHARRKREGLQEKLTVPTPTLGQALPLYTKDALTGMARAALPWGGWSALRKAELIARIVHVLTDGQELARLVEDLEPTTRQASKEILDAGGAMPWTEFDARYGNDLDESPYWNYHVPETTMGQLRLRGLLIETTVDGVLQVAIPAELRPLLEEILA